MRWVADLILALHFAYVLFVIGGLALVWLGIAYGWRWVRNFWFRLWHIAAITLVAIEALVDVTCPLTLLEDWLRSDNPIGSSFVERWAHRILFWDFPSWAFTLVYCAVTLLAVLTWWRWPPLPRARLASILRS